MASLFDKDPASKPPPPTYGLERIEKEIEHLKKSKSTRQLGSEKFALAKWSIGLVIFACILVYLADPLLFSYYKGNAISAYLYLHNYGNDSKAKELTSTGILSREDQRVLDHRSGNFQDYFSSAQKAEDSANTIIAYMDGVQNLHDGNYEKLNLFNKIRYTLFIQTGIPVPTEFDPLNPAVK